MEEKLVTLAIHTYQKALMLKLFLENNGITVFLHNVNLIQPIVSSGVRVRIKETDLPKALKLIEESSFFKELNKTQPKEPKSRREETPKIVLIAIDFSEYSVKACKIGFNYAKQHQASIHLVHSYYSPYFPASLPFGDTFAYHSRNEENIKAIFSQLKAEMTKFKNSIIESIGKGEWDNVPFTCSIREGLPEEEIITLSKELKPLLIIMGTRGKNQKDLDLLGSVAAEVIERSRFPVLAIPENTPFSNFDEVERVAFGTSFDQKDLVAIDILLNQMDFDKKEIFIFHISHRPDMIDDNKLTGIKEYFGKQYPHSKFNYQIVDANDLVKNMDNYISNNKIQLISLAAYRRNMLSRLFNPSMAQRMLFHTDTPLLVIR